MGHPPFAQQFMVLFPAVNFGDSWLYFASSQKHFSRYPRFPSMGQRRQKRLKTVLPVRLKCGNALQSDFVLAHTLDISHSGVRLAGITEPITTGTVELQYRHRMAEFEVLWVAKNGRDHRVGLRALRPEKDVWGLSLESNHFRDDFDPMQKLFRV